MALYENATNVEMSIDDLVKCLGDILPDIGMKIKKFDHKNNVYKVRIVCKEGKAGQASADLKIELFKDGSTSKLKSSYSVFGQSEDSIPGDVYNKIIELNNAVDDFAKGRVLSIYKNPHQHAVNLFEANLSFDDIKNRLKKIHPNDPSILCSTFDMFRKSGVSLIIQGVIWMAAGFSLSYISLKMELSFFVIFYGAVIYGIFTIARGVRLAVSR